MGKKTTGRATGNELGKGKRHPSGELREKETSEKRKALGTGKPTNGGGGSSLRKGELQVTPKLDTKSRVAHLEQGKVKNLLCTGARYKKNVMWTPGFPKPKGEGKGALMLMGGFDPKDQVDQRIHGVIHFAENQQKKHPDVKPEDGIRNPMNEKNGGGRGNQEHR